MNELLVTPRLVSSPVWKDLPVEVTDALVIGSGVAGLRAAIAAAEWGRVMVLAKDRLAETNSQYAQGGVAAALAEDDSYEKHAEDTLAAGQGMADPDAVRFLVTEGARRVKELVEWGGNFDCEGNRLLLTQEGGHSHRRIVHAGGDATGREIQSVLLRRAHAMPSIRLRENAFVLDLVGHDGRVCGALVHRDDGKACVIWARAVILASGGAGQVYRETTNPSVATADGEALAFRAGAVLRDMEFVQFHPTTFYVAGAARKLVSEAVRGEGAYLRDARGERFMPSYHARAELAPRDVVSRSILAQMRKTGTTHVFLDLTHLDPEAMRRRFPGLADLCREYHIDITREGVPVHPSAHYMIGGVRVDKFGRSNLKGLYACGEVASSGVHGANRLGSNSLLECLVYGASAGESAFECDEPPSAGQVLGSMPGDATAGPMATTPEIEDARQSLRSLMWRAVGIERDGDGLRAAERQILHWSSYLLPYCFAVTRGVELQNMLTTARLIVRSAIVRQETRGVHFRRDFPNRDDEHFRRSLVLWRDSEGRLKSAIESPGGHPDRDVSR
ncbi:MAG: L-aspartate oxidase [Planctomycetes bacterium]|nr:L-aspartate oxidase [Planctomycetota bacterium]